MKDTHYSNEFYIKVLQLILILTRKLFSSHLDMPKECIIFLAKGIHDLF